MAKSISDANVKMAVDITIAAVAQAQGGLATHPDVVAKFLETIATKIDELRTGSAA